MATYNYLDNDGLLYLWQKLKTTFAKIEDLPSKVSDLTNDSNYQTLTQVDNLVRQMIADANIPTKTSDLANDSTFQTLEQVTALINDAIGDVTGLKFEPVTALPATGEAGTIYLLQKGTAITGNSYDEYIWYNNAWELIGTTDIDLSGYVKTSDLVAITNAQIDTILAS